MQSSRCSNGNMHALVASVGSQSYGSVRVSQTPDERVPPTQPNELTAKVVIPLMSRCLVLRFVWKVQKVFFSCSRPGHFGHLITCLRQTSSYPSANKQTIHVDQAVCAQRARRSHILSLKCCFKGTSPCGKMRVHDTEIYRRTHTQWRLQTGAALCFPLARKCECTTSSPLAVLAGSASLPLLRSEPWHWRGVEKKACGHTISVDERRTKQR